MTETLIRSRTDRERTIEWSILGTEGAVSFSVHTADERTEFGAIALHYIVTEGHERQEFSSVSDCHLLDAGRCNGDATWLHGKALGATWDATGRRDETIYAELEDWYASRLAR